MTITAAICECGHEALIHDYRFRACYETGEGNCNCVNYEPAFCGNGCGRRIPCRHCEPDSDPTKEPR